MNELSELAIEDDDAPKLNESPKATRPAPPPPGASHSQPGDLLSILQERIEMYATAEQNAKETGESSRARRYSFDFLYCTRFDVIKYFCTDSIAV